MNLKESAHEWFMELQDMITAGVESYESTKMVEKENKREGCISVTEQYTVIHLKKQLLLTHV